LSPGSEARERERVSVLLEINRELLRECLRLQTSQNEAKKEDSTVSAASTASPDGPEKDKAEKEKAEKEKTEKAKQPASRDYFEYVESPSFDRSCG